MSLNSGSVSIAADGTETKSGGAERVYDILKAGLSALGPTVTGDAMVAQRKAWAVIANAVSQGLILEFTTNGKARVGGAVAGLQKTPTPNDPGVATVAHGGANIDLPIV